MTTEIRVSSFLLAGLLMAGKEGRDLKTNEVLSLKDKGVSR